MWHFFLYQVINNLRYTIDWFSFLLLLYFFFCISTILLFLCKKKKKFFIRNLMTITATINERTLIYYSTYKGVIQDTFICISKT